MIFASGIRNVHFVFLLLGGNLLELAAAYILPLILLTIVLFALFLLTPLAIEPLGQVVRYPGFVLPLHLCALLEKKYAGSRFA